MPFDIAPKETEVAPFQWAADAILRGCAITKPIRPSRGAVETRNGCVTHACVWGALLLGSGVEPGSMKASQFNYRGLLEAYSRKYGVIFISDYTTVGRTREQIAARIAAL